MFSMFDPPVSAEEPCGEFTALGHQELAVFVNREDVVARTKHLAHGGGLNPPSMATAVSGRGRGSAFPGSVGTAGSVCALGCDGAGVSRARPA
jgi:hypothetical protein